jgi:hypothetical protein
MSSRTRNRWAMFWTLIESLLTTAVCVLAIVMLTIMIHRLLFT